MLIFNFSRQYSVGFEITTVNETNPGAPGAFKKTSSGDYRWCTYYDMGMLKKLYTVFTFTNDNMRRPQHQHFIYIFKFVVFILII